MANVWLKINGDWQNSKLIRRMDHELHFPSIIMIDAPYILVNHELDMLSINMIDVPYILDISNKGLYSLVLHNKFCSHLDDYTFCFSYQKMTAPF